MQMWACLKDPLKWLLIALRDFPGGSDSKESACIRTRFHPWVGKIPWKRKWQPTPVFLPGKSYGQRSLMGYNPWSHKELDMSEWLTHTSLLRTRILEKAVHELGPLYVFYPTHQFPPRTLWDDQLLFFFFLNSQVLFFFLLINFLF